MPHSIEKTISANLLLHNFNKFASNYDSDYPQVKNPSAIIEGIRSVMKAIGDGAVPDNTLLYIIEDPQDEENPRGARYVLIVTQGRFPDHCNDFAVKLVYTGTNEMESISTFEDNQVIWSPDTLENSHHKTRTKYYLGFIYMLCDKSPGFEEEPQAELELTLEDLIALGIEGELPAELIEITLDEQEGEMVVEGDYEPGQSIVEDASAAEVVSASFDAMAEELFGGGIEEEVPEQDDTEVLIMSPEAYEEEYDDLQTDYEELFE